MIADYLVLSKPPAVTSRVSTHEEGRVTQVSASGGSSFDTSPVGGVDFSVTTLDRAADWVVKRTRTADSVAPAISFSNSWCVALADQDPAYREILHANTMVTFPDGLPIVWALKLSGVREAGRVTGPSLFREVLDRGRAEGVRHYLLGSTPETLSALMEAAQERYPGVTIAGSWSPPFGPVTDQLITEAASRVRGSDANMVWVGMGTPKQDDVSMRLAPLVGVPVAGVGAAFDFVAGTVSEAPAWIQAVGLEWFFRFASEPRRLWRRYLIGNLRFVRAVGKHWRRSRHDR